MANWNLGLMAILLGFSIFSDLTSASTGRKIRISGSFLALSHASSDIETGLVAAGTERYNERSAVPITPRTRAQVTRFFDGLDIVEPGVVPLGHWHPGPLQQFDSPGLPTYCAVGRKP